MFGKKNLPVPFTRLTVTTRNDEYNAKQGIVDIRNLQMLPSCTIEIPESLTLAPSEIRTVARQGVGDEVIAYAVGKDLGYGGPSGGEVRPIFAQNDHV